MCRRVTCKTCNRPTWAGCGAHVEQVLGGVPAAQRCQCRSGAAVASGKAAKPSRAFKSARTVQPFNATATGAGSSDTAAVDKPATRRSLLSRLRGR